MTGKGCGSELVIGIKAAAGKACIPHASRPLAGQAAGRCRGSDMASGVARYAANGVASGVILIGVLVSKWMRQRALCTHLPCEARSEERRVGKEGGRTCRYGGWPD